ncbi:aminotransferase-like domain-containing protein [Catelliglobosispora koreensis]|uniref:aminotransferase-like domain-containing protein n=1 Tax=Catelliglobosispora koreensis TaxID=129052 RepID=UPI00037423AA|nr:PLP-dependent aminotransferase family protein [Catelliglobosispora koreensis]
MENDSTFAGLISTLRSAVDELSPGDRLPSSRVLVERYRVSPVTVARAVAQLAAEGAVVTRPGSGTYVAPRARAAKDTIDTGWQTVALTDRAVDIRSLSDALSPVLPGSILLDGGYLHRSLQSGNALSAALARAGRRPDAWERTPPNGLPELRAIFAAYTGLAADDVLITAGGQSALSMAFRAIAAPGSPILVESPTYPGALAAARAAGLRPVPVPIDEEGLRPDLLADAFAMTGARVLFCQPCYQNPTGATLSADRRKQILDIARASGAFVIEDDFARHLAHHETPPRPLITDDRDGHVVYVTSLSKPAAPSLRIGAIIARGPVMERLRAIRQVDDFFITRPMQEATLELLSSPAWDRHLRVLSVALRDRCRDLSQAIAHHCPNWTVSRPAGGLHLWVTLPPGVDDTALANAARQQLVTACVGRRYFAAEPPGAYLRLSFAEAADSSELAEGARRLGAASLRG